jgi:hypothetical protein
MRQGERFGLSVLQKSDLWRRWKAGQSLHEIGRTFGKSHSSIRCVVSRHGGFVPQSGDARCWHSHCLTERTSLEGSLPVRRFERSPSSRSEPCREVARHGGRPEYRKMRSRTRPKSNLGTRNPEKRPEYNAWIEWATRLADRIDPFVFKKYWFGSAN